MNLSSLENCESSLKVEFKRTFGGAPDNINNVISADHVPSDLSFDQYGSIKMNENPFLVVSTEAFPLKSSFRFTKGKIFEFMSKLKESYKETAQVFCEGYTYDPENFWARTKDCRIGIPGSYEWISDTIIQFDKRNYRPSKSALKMLVDESIQVTKALFMPRISKNNTAKTWHFEPQIYMMTVRKATETELKSGSSNISLDDKPVLQFDTIEGSDGLHIAKIGVYDKTEGIFVDSRSVVDNDNGQSFCIRVGEDSPIKKLNEFGAGLKDLIPEEHQDAEYRPLIRDTDDGQVVFVKANFEYMRIQDCGSRLDPMESTALRTLLRAGRSAKLILNLNCTIYTDRDGCKKYCLSTRLLRIELSEPTDEMMLMAKESSKSVGNSAIDVEKLSEQEIHDIIDKIKFETIKTQNQEGKDVETWVPRNDDGSPVPRFNLGTMNHFKPTLEEDEEFPYVGLNTQYQGVPLLDGTALKYQQALQNLTETSQKFIQILDERLGSYDATSMKTSKSKKTIEYLPIVKDGALQVSIIPQFSKEYREELKMQKKPTTIQLRGLGTDYHPKTWESNTDLDPLFRLGTSLTNVTIGLSKVVVTDGGRGKPFEWEVKLKMASCESSVQDLGKVLEDCDEETVAA